MSRMDIRHILALGLLDSVQTVPYNEGLTLIVPDMLAFEKKSPNEQYIGECLFLIDLGGETIKESERANYGICFLIGGNELCLSLYDKTNNRPYRRIWYISNSDEEDWESYYNFFRNFPNTT